MEVVAHLVNPAIILGYAFNQPKEGIPVWEQVVLDASTITPMLLSGRSALIRKGYGLYVGDVMAGYAVVDESTQSLDLMHICATKRGKGLSKTFLKQLNIKNVCVDENNHVAFNLYTQLGYEIELIKDYE